MSLAKFRYSLWRLSLRVSAGNVHPVMLPSITALLTVIRSSLRTRVELEAEILALRHQLAVLQQTAPRRLRLSQADRLLWVLLSGVWSRWREPVQIVQPATVVSWHRRLFAWHWRWRSARPRLGRPPIATDVRALIQKLRNERSLRRTLKLSLAYYHEWRPRLSSDKDAPIARAVQPPACGTIVQVPHVGGIHHHYERRAA